MQDKRIELALPGAWRLRSWEIVHANGRAPGHPFGTDATGLLLYTADGWMSAGIARAQRPRFDSENARLASTAEKCAAFDGYFHYQGRWHVRDGQVHHQVSEALNPNFPGTAQVRDARLAGTQLTLSADERGPDGELVRVHRLCWERAAGN